MIIFLNFPKLVYLPSVQKSASFLSSVLFLGFIAFYFVWFQVLMMQLSIQAAAALSQGALLFNINVHLKNEATPCAAFIHSKRNSHSEDVG